MDISYSPRWLRYPMKKGPMPWEEAASGFHLPPVTCVFLFCLAATVEQVSRLVAGILFCVVYREALSLASISIECAFRSHKFMREGNTGALWTTLHTERSYITSCLDSEADLLKPSSGRVAKRKVYDRELFQPYIQLLYEAYSPFLYGESTWWIGGNSWGALWLTLTSRCLVITRLMASERLKASPYRSSFSWSSDPYDWPWTKLATLSDLISSYEPLYLKPRFLIRLWEYLEALFVFRTLCHGWLPPIPPEFSNSEAIITMGVLIASSLNQNVWNILTPTPDVLCALIRAGTAGSAYGAIDHLGRQIRDGLSRRLLYIMRLWRMEIADMRNFFLLYGDALRETLIGRVLSFRLPLFQLASTLRARLQQAISQSPSLLKTAILQWTRPAVKPNMTRIVWNCKCCQKELYADLDSSRPKETEKLLQSLNQGGTSSSNSASSSPSPPPAARSGDSQPSPSSTSDLSTLSSSTNSLAAGPSRNRKKPRAVEYDRAHRPRFLELCINTGPLRSPGEVNLTRVRSDAALFHDIRREYRAVRGFRATRHFLLRPVAIRYVHFALERATRRVHVFSAPSYPTSERIAAGDWDCVAEPPPPMPSESFIHYLTGCRKDLSRLSQSSAWLGRLPKKLDRSIFAGQAPLNEAWGIHIVEGLDWPKILWILSGFLCFVGVPLTVYTFVAADFASGVGVGSLFVAVVTLQLMVAKVMQWKQE